MTHRFSAAALGRGLIAAPAGVITSANDNGHTYYLLTESSWQASEAEAVGLGGHLATVSDQAEQGLVFGTFGPFGGVDRGLWVGLNDAAVEGMFVWSSGEAVASTNWAPGEPNNGSPGGDEDYVDLVRTGNVFGYPAGTWNDLPGVGGPGIHGVVEVNSAPAAVPEPEPAVLFGTGLAGVCRRRRAAVG